MLLEGLEEEFFRYIHGNDHIDEMLIKEHAILVWCNTHRNFRAYLHGKMSDVYLEVMDGYLNGK